MSEGSSRRVSYKQLKQLCEFLNSNREIAVGFNKSIQARDHSRSRWKIVAANLNAHKEGAWKDWKGWCKYWVDYKSKLKRLVMTSKAAQQRTGGGPPAKQFTELECRFLHIMGEDFGSTPGATGEPFKEEIEQEKTFEVYMPLYSLSSNGSISLVTPPVPKPPRARPRLGSKTESPPASADIPTITSSLPGPTSPAVETQMQTAESSPRHHQDAVMSSPRQSLDAQTPRTSSRRPQRTRREPTMSAEASRRALIEVSDRRAEAEVNRNRILDERLQLICMAIQNNNKDVQELTLAVNNLTKTINSRFPEQR